MPISVAVAFGGAQRNCILDRLPDTCPTCHTAGAPVDTAIIAATPTWLEKVLRCPSQACEHLYIARYQCTYQPAPGSGNPYQYSFQTSLPVVPRPSGQPDTVVKLSPTFKEVFQQSETAQQLGLAHISGVGYRKALEFLVKDYACYRHPDDADKIKGLPLAQTIKDFIADERIREVAKRAAWLGNDETHYIRKWEDKDIRDLKALTHLTVNWIDMEITTEQLLLAMPEPKR